MKYNYLLLLFFVFSTFAQAQTDHSGRIRNDLGEPVAYATVSASDGKGNTSTDSKGFYRIAVNGAYPFTVSVKAIGYEKRDLQIGGVGDSLMILKSSGSQQLSEVVVSSRRRDELLEDVPIPISVIGGTRADEAGAFNVNRLKELVPTVQLYSSNPRNTGVSIRGLGTTFGLTNDGIEPGVGFYVDGVYYARAAATTLDFVDIERIEVLRGPQGTLFGKNTVAGAFNIVTRKPSFESNANFESSFGNFGFIQTKASVSGPLSERLAARISFTGTQRDGLLYNTFTERHTNELNNLGGRLQLLYKPSEKVEVLLGGDFSRQRPDGYAQVLAGYVTTERATYRQFEQIINDLNYQPPSWNPFDRLIDHDTPWRSDQDLGGVSLNVDIDLWGGTLTSTSAWRFWNWNPSNDRDFLGLQALRLSQAPSRHDQWSQEIRWAGALSSRLNFVGGIFAFGQRLNPDPAHTEEAGRDQWRFSQNSESPLWQTPGLLDGFGIRSYPRLNSFSGAIFGQLDWSLSEKLRLLPGFRVNYDEKKVDFSRIPYGGLETDDPELLALKRSVYSEQSFSSEIDDTNFSGQLTVDYKPNEQLNTFATFSTGFKPVGLNLGGLPTVDGRVMTELAVIKPERVYHYELGLKSRPTSNSTASLTVFNTDVRDYQAQVQAADLSINRGYLANAEQVRVRGVEVDGSVNVKRFLWLTASVAYTEGTYIRFENAPPPLEETGGPTFKDISGQPLPGISKWAGTFSAEFTQPARVLNMGGEVFLASDIYSRSSFSSSPSPSRFLNIDGYALVNGRLGFRSADNKSIFIWARNIFDKDYFEQLLPGAGNAGHYAAVLGDPRTFGITLRYTFL